MLLVEEHLLHLLQVLMQQQVLGLLEFQTQDPFLYAAAARSETCRWASVPSDRPSCGADLMGHQGQQGISASSPQQELGATMLKQSSKKPKIGPEAGLDSRRVKPCNERDSSSPAMVRHCFGAGCLDGNG
jgi:hypothetical protein